MAMVIFLILLYIIRCSSVQMECFSLQNENISSFVQKKHAKYKGIFKISRYICGTKANVVF